MIENSNPISPRLELLELDAVETPKLGHNLNAGPVEAHGKRILLVEDQEALRACLRMVLELEGHHVTESCNGAEALSLFTPGEFDLVITDLEMPVMAGNQLAVGLKLLAPVLPILMITAYERACRNPENPVDVLLHKPFTVAHLHGALDELLSAHPQPAQLDPVPAPITPSVAFAPEDTACCSHAA